MSVKSFLHHLVSREYRLKMLDKITHAIKAFSLTERIIFIFFVSLFALSSFLLAVNVSSRFMVEIPRVGGSISEGVIGSPRFINPLLAVSDTDKDLTSLIYSGLMRADAKGNIIPDLAETYTVSPDGLSYIFTIKANAVFHDGTPITADDVLFTIQKATDPGLKSPKRANWDGILVERVDEHNVKFTLRQPYAPFLANTTLGILPKHIWDGVSNEEFTFSNFNVEPIGSGPYKMSSVHRNSSGIAEYYILKTFKKFTLGEAFISQITLRFYPNEKTLTEAIRSKEVKDVHSINPETAKQLESEGFILSRFPLSRVFGLFFNQNQNPVFVHHEVRQALDAATDKERIVQEVLLGYGTTISRPVPPGIPDYSEETLTGDVQETEEIRISRATDILTKAGWKKNENGIFEKKTGKSTETLSFSIYTGDATELKKTAEILKSDWEKLGAHVDVKVFSSTDLNQNVIRSRKYDALLFGEIIGRDLDFYAFWHSSQRNDPGLNIALYTNSKVDKALEEARASTDSETRIEKHRQFVDEVTKDIPAVFIYSPDLIYTVSKDIKGLIPGQVRSASDRFSNIYQWYIETDKVWSIFTDQHIN